MLVLAFNCKWTNKENIIQSLWFTDKSTCLKLYVHNNAALFVYLFIILSCRRCPSLKCEFAPVCNNQLTLMRTVKTHCISGYSVNTHLVDFVCWPYSLSSFCKIRLATSLSSQKHAVAVSGRSAILLFAFQLSSCNFIGLKFL